MNRIEAAGLAATAAVLVGGCSSPEPASAPAAPAVAAPDPDATFFKILSDAHIGTGNREREKTRSDGVCSLLHHDQYSLDVVVGGLESNGFSTADAGFYVGAAVATLCPDPPSSTS